MEEYSVNKIKELLTLHTTQFLNFYQVIYENRLGQNRNWFVASRKSAHTLEKQLLEQKEDEADAVLIIAVHEDEEKLVLIKQFRIPLNAYIYELPAGLIDAGEDAFCAAQRELKEETGLEITSIDRDQSIQKAYLSPGMTDESVSLVYCKCKGTLSTAFMEADEEIQPMLVSKEAAREILASGEKIDIKALLILKQFLGV